MSQSDSSFEHDHSHDLIQRPRRLRKNATIRAMTRQTRLSASSLVYPLFAVAGSGICDEISAMPGQYRYSPDRIPFAVEGMLNAGVNAFLLFGIPDSKDETGSGAWQENGIVQQAVREIKARFPEAWLICDVCLCEYTSHGHCGVLREDGTVDNDATLPLLAKTACSQALAGADMVAPSDMVDGRVGAIRNMLDEASLTDMPILSYAAKYASAFYGPFREAAGSAPAFGDRKSYQMDYHNAREALHEIELDIEEGADAIIVKPAMSYLDIVSAARAAVKVPVAAYSVSGEYSMIKAASAAGYIDEDSIVAESAVAVYRAGADILISYYADKIAGFIKQGRIG